MKASEIKDGEEYAVRRGSYGSVARMLMLGREKVDVKVYRGFGSGRVSRTLLRMRQLGDGYYSEHERHEEKLPEGEFLVPARDAAHVGARGGGPQGAGGAQARGGAAGARGA